VVWDGDWQHPPVESEMPDGGICSNCFSVWTPTWRTQSRILVTNPATLVWLPEMKVSPTNVSKKQARVIRKYHGKEIYARHPAGPTADVRSTGSENRIAPMN